MLGAMADLPPHLLALHRSLRAEQDAEVAALASLAEGSLADRVDAGVSWPRLRVESVRRQGRKLVADLRAERGVVLHEGLDAGDPVHLVAHGRSHPAVVTLRDRRVAEVRGERLPEEGTVVEVRRRADPATWVRYRQALERGAEADTRLVRQLLAVPVIPDRGTGEGALLPGLDEAQQRAADHALRAEHLAAIHGPPGTGKTHVLAAIARCLVDRGERVWALADSNAAVDHLTRTMAARGLDVVRLGRPLRMADDVLPHALPARLEASPLAEAIAALERDLGRADDPRERRRLAVRLREVVHQAEDHVLSSAQVIASTFGTLAHRAEHLPPAHTALVDEATQATEPAVWVAVPHIERLVLCGDPEQLGPVCRVPGPLQTSLLERVLWEGRVDAPMLEVQHRMAADLRRLVQPVYGAAYRDAPSAGSQVLHGDDEVLGPLAGRRALWIDTAGAGWSDAVDEVTRSTYNDGEVRLVTAVVRRLLEGGVAPRDIGVITPYSAQVARIEDQLPGIEVASANAFQGQERPVMVASWVRSNDRGELGFVADGRRLTVTLTRARCLLVCIGDSATLAGHGRFGEVIEQLAEGGGLMSVFEEPWADVLG
jgi:hypothetical protein